jgi:hypothetical protein
MKRKRIPTSVTFPFGFVVKIRQLPHEEFEHETGGGCLACWFSDDRTIYLDTGRPITKRRADLAHEMLHAAADWQVWVLGTKHANARD